LQPEASKSKYESELTAMSKRRIEVDIVSDIA